MGFKCPMHPDVTSDAPGKCPKCGMPFVDESISREHHEHHHVHKDEAAKPIGKPGQWTCPMHPEIVRDGPGSCPKCGMALEPILPTADSEENPELSDMTRRLWIAAFL